ncbi:MAG: tRNA (adenosine(37)-N6)-threonylcarbamoyltransferase complex dimerization subunit type 1 TsaB [Verrucomicrobiota bacterium]|nr:tRNA (adenosine(37)-N6)-threonylcarbamoyltransferase complex dimerization subunit type 1 TsaB [Verrucomicrobiota bacterium]
MRSVAAVKAEPGEQPTVVATVSDAGSKGTRAFQLISTVLKNAAWKREEVDAIAVGLGPGSYHGVRVAIAIAQGWSVARQVRLIGVSSADALAAMIALKGQQEPFAVAIDAQRGEFYRADYMVESGVARVVGTLRLVKAADIEQCLKSAKNVFGPDLPDRLPGVREAFPVAATVGFLAAKMPIETSAASLEPIYLRETAFVKAPPPRFA